MDACANRTLGKPPASRLAVYLSEIFSRGRRLASTPMKNCRAARVQMVNKQAVTGPYVDNDSASHK